MPSVKVDDTPQWAGLCGNCLHARLLRSDRGSTFLQCALSFTDPRFVKYPRLPVLSCSGYVEKMPADKEWG